jgi:hypothetical protein
MSEQKAKRRRKQRAQIKATPQRHPLRWRKPTMLIGIVLLLILTGGILAGWRNARVTSRTPLLAPLPTPTPSPVALSKEYIYAGGRLVATEEPSNSNPLLSTPTAFVAATTSASRIDLSWTASSGPVHHYEIEKTGATQPIIATTNSFPDTSVEPDTAYLYKVRAVDASGHVSPYSNVDLATAITFDNDPLTSPPAAKVAITVQHLFQLRRAINAVRQLAGLTNATWTHTHSPTPGSIYAVDVMEMRTNLDQALTALNLPVLPYIESDLSGHPRIKKEHFQQLRDRVK